MVWTLLVVSGSFDTHHSPPSGQGQSKEPPVGACGADAADGISSARAGTGSPDLAREPRNARRRPNPMAKDRDKGKKEKMNKPKLTAKEKKEKKKKKREEAAK
jgi:hypothetical protein